MDWLVLLSEMISNTLSDDGLDQYQIDEAFMIFSLWLIKCVNSEQYLTFIYNVTQTMLWYYYGMI